MKFYALLCLATCFLGGCVIEESHHEGDPFDDDAGADGKDPPATTCTGGNNGTGNNGTGAGGNGSSGTGTIDQGGGWSAGGTTGTAGTTGDPGGSAGTGSTEPPPPPSCTDLETEAACSDRADCTPIYAGTDCSCGPECTCIGGEPGCICESFGFLVCIEAEE